MASAMQAASTSAAVNWVFENKRRMGGAAGEAYTNTLESSGMPPASVLAREAIQNSVDAKAEEDAKVSVEFVFKSLMGQQKREFARLIDLATVVARADNLGFKKPNCVDELDDDNSPLNLLYINDYNTTGLEGDPDDDDSKFYRFLLSLGDGGKEHDEHRTGGSYGYGKSVYSSNSDILTIFAYSRTRDGSGKPHSLLFGCGYYRKHKFGGQNYPGRAWFGIDDTPAHEGAEQAVLPFTGAEADQLAAELGFSPRGANELGTSVMVVGATVDPDGILAGVEDWWWPRLISNLLDVKVVRADGKAELPRPRKREALRPFLEAFDIVTGKTPPNGKTEFRKVFNRYEGDAIGIGGFKVLQRLDDGSYLVDEDRVDAVALIRGPLMVVKYHRHWQIGNPAMAGVFLADGDIDDVLRAAEPPAHDRWDADARRLRDQSGHKQHIVRRVLNGIRQTLKQFQGTASPPAPPRPKRLTILERTLASFLTASKRGTRPGPNPSTAPISLTYESEPQAVAVDQDLRLVSTFAVRLKPDEDMDKMRLRVRVSCPVVEELQEGESLKVHVSATVPLSPDEAKPGWQTFELVQGKTVRFECETEDYNALWTVRFVPEIEAMESE